MGALAVVVDPIAQLLEEKILKRHYSRSAREVPKVIRFLTERALEILGSRSQFQLRRFSPAVYFFVQFQVKIWEALMRKITSDYTLNLPNLYDET